MPTCLNCNTDLKNEITENGQIQNCPNCNSKLIGAANVKRSKIDSTVYHEMWINAKNEKNKKGRICPTCGQNMSLQSFAHVSKDIAVEICIHCYHFWFDFTEFEKLPRVEPVNYMKEIDPEVQRAFDDVDRKIREIERGNELDSNKKGFFRRPDTVWEYIAGLFGLPVEEEGSFFEFYPYITWTFTLMCFVTFFMVFGELREYVFQLGFIPSQWSRYFGLTMITSMIMHGSMWHVISNMYFLLAFGDNVEDYLGRIKFVLLLIASHGLGLLLHSFFDPSKDIPLVGASAAVSGVMAFYATMFPKKKNAIIFMIYFRFIKISLRVWVYFLIWSLFQILVIIQQVGGIGSVSGLGHLGGVMIGLAFASYLKSGKK
ncbi:MAG: rhomboid family intramembrane serine protease [Candidatus Cloacimonetes bacterium]|nr:rhomboid family intramembrane serine protease [Candidatus Cloacimonadota bacterium]